VWIFFSFSNLSISEISITEVLQAFKVSGNGELYAQAVKDGIIQESHFKDLQNSTMTTVRLMGLYITIQQRRSK